MPPLALADLVLSCAVTACNREGRVMTEEEEDLASLVPSFLTDVQQYIQIAAYVRNPHFNVPYTVTYSRFLYILQQLASLTSQPEFLSLDPSHKISDKDKKIALRQVDREHLQSLNNLCVLITCNTVDQIKDLPLSQSGDNARVVNDIMVYNIDDVKFNLWYKYISFNSIDSERSRTMLVREIAARSSSVSVRTLLSLGDPTIPLCVIPGVGNLYTLYSMARSSPTVMLP